MKLEGNVRRKLGIILLTTAMVLALGGCKKSTSKPENETTSRRIQQTTAAHPDTKGPNRTEGQYYKPNEFKNMNLNKWDSRWCWERSKESEHFYVFWEKEFGNDPNSVKIPNDLKVDIDDLLEKAEEFYRINTEVLGFQDNKNGYKFQIYVLYQKEWLATGSGYDDKVGALWVNPSTCKPVGSTIAHEIGHSFQYVVYCNALADTSYNNYQSGFRYVYPGENVGNGFWEQTAQWQAMQSYPNEFFIDYNMTTWFNNCHRAFEHEWMRYQGYWLHEYLSKKHGITTIARIWNESSYPEDALGTYMRLYHNQDCDKLYDELFDYAAHMATFDIEGIRDMAGDWRLKYDTKLIDTDNGYKQVAYEGCPEITGFNVIPIFLEEGSKSVKLSFVGLENGQSLAEGDEGQYLENEKAAGNTNNYNKAENMNIGWRYGFVAYCQDGSRVYGDMYKDKEKNISFDIPDNAKELYLVILGAADEYYCHGWDEKEINDFQTPYKIRYSFTK